MALFIVERNVLDESAEKVAEQSCHLNSADGIVQWQRTYRTHNKVYSLYHAANAEQLRRLAYRHGYIIHRLVRVKDELWRPTETQ